MGNANTSNNPEPTQEVIIEEPTVSREDLPLNDIQNGESDTTSHTQSHHSLIEMMKALFEDDDEDALKPEDQNKPKRSFANALHGLQSHVHMPHIPLILTIPHHPRNLKKFRQKLQFHPHPILHPQSTKKKAPEEEDDDTLYCLYFYLFLFVHRYFSVALKKPEEEENPDWCKCDECTCFTVTPPEAPKAPEAPEEEGPDASTATDVRKTSDASTSESSEKPVAPLSPFLAAATQARVARKETKPSTPKGSKSHTPRSLTPKASKVLTPKEPEDVTTTDPEVTKSSVKKLLPKF